MRALDPLGVRSREGVDPLRGLGPESAFAQESCFGFELMVYAFGLGLNIKV